MPRTVLSVVLDPGMRVASDATEEEEEEEARDEDKEVVVVNEEREFWDEWLGGITPEREV